MMMRYLPLLVKRNIKRLVVYSHPALKRVFANIPGGNHIDVVPITEALPFDAFDLYCPIMSLPYLFKTRLDTIPNKVPYLFIPEEMKQWWRTRLAEITGVKVGLVWAGGKLASTDKNRSILIKKFALLTAMEGVRWVNLQKGQESGQLKELGWDLIDWMDECEDYLETAALVDQLDLVISVDTSVAHLAGALGKPVWLLNRFNSEWRWLLGREDSPWYPSMRIFRQRERGDWHGVIKQVADVLMKLPPTSR